MPDAKQAEIAPTAAAKMPERRESTVAQEGRTISRCDFHQGGRLSAIHTRALTTLNDNFARNLARAIAAYLRVNFDCALISVELIAYREVLKRVPSPEYVASFTSTGQGGRGLMQMDLSVALPIIDLLLGGEGGAASNIRALTEIEESVVETVVRLVCHDLASAWQPLGVSFEFQEREPAGSLPKVMPPEERTLAIRFEITVAEVKGEMNLVFPGLLSSALLRRLAHDSDYQRPGPTSGNERMRELLMDCDFGFALSFEKLRLPAAEAVSLAAGQVVALRRSVDKDATASVAGIPMFLGRAARSGDKRAAQIVAALGTPDGEQEIGPMKAVIGRN